jgi:hypothetical protein
MAIISKTFTFSAGEVISASEHNTNFDTLYNLVNANIDNVNIKTGAGIENSKLNLASISQAVAFNGTLDFSGATITAQATFADLVATTADINGGTIGGVTFDGNLTMSIGSDADGDMYYRSSNLLTRLAKGAAGQVMKMNSGATAPEWVNGTGYQFFSSSGTFTVPAGITRVYITAVGGGGGGNRQSSGSNSGGGGGGAAVINRPVSVTPAANITVTVGAGGAGRSGSNGAGVAGTASSFSGHTAPGGGVATTSGGTGGGGFTLMDGGNPAAGVAGSIKGGDGGTGTNGGGGGGSFFGAGGAGGTSNGSSAADNSGGGGGGVSGSGSGGNGGSGFVLVAW